MPIVTRSQSKKMRLKDISEKGDRDSLTKRSLLLSLHEIQLRLIILEEDPEKYQKIYGKKELINEEQNSISDMFFDNIKKIINLILFLICYFTFYSLFYVAKKIEIINS